MGSGSGQVMEETRVDGGQVVRCLDKAAYFVKGSAVLQEPDLVWFRVRR